MDARIVILLIMTNYFIIYLKFKTRFIETTRTESPFIKKIMKYTRNS